MKCQRTANLRFLLTESQITAALILKNNWLSKIVKEQKNYAKAKALALFFCKIAKEKRRFFVVGNDFVIVAQIINCESLPQAAHH